MSVLRLHHAENRMCPKYDAKKKFTWAADDVKIMSLPEVKLDMDMLDTLAEEDDVERVSRRNLPDLISQKIKVISMDTAFEKSILSLNVLLELYGFPLPTGNTVKLVFHTTSEYDFLNYLHQEHIQKIETYQREQRKHVFKNCEYIISFLPVDPSRALFLGIYHIDGHHIPDAPPSEFLRDLPEKQWHAGTFCYDMTRLNCMSELSERLVIDWGASSRAWHQWLRKETPKKVSEILPSILRPEFPGFDELILDYSQLKSMIANPAAYRSWHNILESVSGVYLIVDRDSGKQYVGAAYGNDGILGRWRDYAKTGHGGNKELQQCHDFSAFQFSILYICSKSKSQKDVLGYETLFKKKLGSLAHGLNHN